MRGLFIVHSDLDSLQAKGVADKIAERDEDGFLDRVITLHPLADRDRVEKAASRHPVHELKMPAPAKFRPLSWARFALHLARAVRYAKRLIAENNVDFVRSQDPYFSGLIGYLATRRPRTPFCISVHADYDMQERLSPGTAAPHIFGSRALAKRLERFLFRRADMTLGVSGHTMIYASQNGAISIHRRLFRHIIDTASFLKPCDPQALASLNLPRDRRVLSVVSRLSKGKFIFDYIELALLLRERRSDFVIVIGGGGPEDGALRRKIREHDLHDYVQLLGPISQPQVRALRQHSYVNLALLDGASLIEACASGRPVAGYATEWQAEIVHDTVSGRLVPEGRIRELAGAISEMLDDEEKTDQMGAIGRDNVLKMFDRDTLIAQHRMVYTQLASRQWDQIPPSGR